MHALRKKNMIFISIILIFVVIPVIYINLGNYNISSSLSKTEEKEYLQVLYSLSASMMILLYYGIKWFLKKASSIVVSLTVLNLLGLITLVLLFKTLEHHLLMEADFYYLIVYAEIVIVHLMHHIFTKTSIL